MSGFIPKNSNVGKQDKMVMRPAGPSSASPSNNSPSGEMSTVSSIASGPVEGPGMSSGGHFAASGRRVVSGPQDRMTNRGSDSRNRQP